MITKELIDEINALARKQRSIGLTDEEKIRQNQLRKKYLAGFRENMKNILDRVEIVDALRDSKLNYLIPTYFSSIRSDKTYKFCHN